MATKPLTAEPDVFPLLDLTADGIAVVVPDPWHFIYANPAFMERLRCQPGGIQDCEVTAVLDQSLCARLLPQMDHLWHCGATATDEVVEIEVGEIGRGESRLHLRCIELAGAPAIGLIVKRSTDTSNVAQQTRRDELTGLPGRDFLFARLAAHLGGERSADWKYAVLFIDLDNFKQVNDEHGHLIGDRVLREAAQRISECVREGDHVVRYGGDEFVVLLEGVTGRDEIDPILCRIHDALARPIAWPEGEVTLSLSIGVAEASPAHQSPEDILNDADRAMYAAKRTSV